MTVKNINKTEVTTFNNNNVKDSFITMFNNENEYLELFNSNILSNYAHIIIEQIEFNIDVVEQGIKLKNKSYLGNCLKTLQSDESLLALHNSNVKKHLNNSKIERYTRFVNNLNFLNDLMLFIKDKKISLELVSDYFKKNNITSQNIITQMVTAGGKFSDKKESKKPSGKVNQTDSNKNDTSESIEQSSKDNFAKLLDVYLNSDLKTQRKLQRVIQNIELDKQTNNKEQSLTKKIFKEYNISDKYLKLA